MERKIKVGIVGYGNVGKGVELALSQNSDFTLVGIFTRRDPDTIDTDSKAIHTSKILDYKDEIDVLILCGGSANDLPKQCPTFANHFNTVDTYDNHNQIPEYFEIVDRVAQKANKVSLISIGWDPGLFSLNRLLAQSILPNGKKYTFWGKGVSQGHSDAIKGIKGVKHGIQYTIPSKEAMEKVRTAHNPHLEAKDMHSRVCYIVPEDFNETDRIEKEIKTMPDYFLDYDTTVYFITEEEFKQNHSNMPHGGYVICTGTTNDVHKQRMEFSLYLDSNPEFTSSVLVAFARAVYRLSKEGRQGAFTIFDIPLAYISPKSKEELRKELL